ncbi:hypothetical protein CAAN4_G19878 [[Candida] anglica]|uniref:Nucleoporin Nup159/Nup146 N-terminal domain-containing protein n=1 Tax=[Candida] anglica TaxID=148631 RepID=A0ABP0EIY2_9ASCO
MSEEIAILDEVASEHFGFKLSEPSEGIRVFDALPFDKVQSRDVDLLSFNNVKHYFACSDMSSLIVESIDVLKGGDEGEVNPKSWARVDGVNDITQLKFNFDGSKLFFLDGGKLLSISNFKKLEPKTVANGQTKRFCPSPTSSKLLILRDNGDLYVDGVLWKSNIMTMSWTLDGEYVIYADSNEVRIAKPLSDTFDSVALVDGYLVLTATEVSLNVILLVFGPESNDPTDHDFKTLVVVLDENKKSTTTYEADVAPPFGAERIGTYYIKTLNNWAKDQTLSFITAASSTDISTIELQKDGDSFQDPKSIVQLNDSDRAQFPLNDDGDDISPVGLALDLTNSDTIVSEPCIGIESAQGLPKLWCLTQEGTLLGWWLYDSAKLSKDEVSLAGPLASLNGEISKPEPKKEVKFEEFNEKPTYSSTTTNNPFGSSTGSVFGTGAFGSQTVKSDNPFGTSTGSPFGGFGNNKPDAPASEAQNKPTTTTNVSGFGISNTATNKPTTSPEKTGGFGSSGFGSSGFGSSGFGSSGFGSTPKVDTSSSSSGFGKSAFGSSGFGSNPAASSTTTSSGFGKSAFGSSGFGSSSAAATTSASSGFGKSAFGSSGFGSSPTTDSSAAPSGFGKSSFGSGAFGSTATGSPFGSLADKSKSSEVSPFGGFGSTERKSSPFAGLSSENKSSSPFAGLSSENKSSSPFAGLSSENKSSSPFAELSSDRSATSSPFDGPSSADLSSTASPELSSTKPSTSNPFGSSTANAFGSLGLSDSNTLAKEESPKATTGGLFGKSEEAPKASSGGLFSKSEEAPKATSGGLFGKSEEAPKESTGGLFGKSEEAPKATSGGLFGKSEEAPKESTGGLFGKSEEAPKSTGGLFGKSEEAPKASSGGLFGKSEEAPKATSGGLFGKSEEAPKATSGGLFGKSEEAPKESTGGLFGKSEEAPKATSGGLFGKSEEAPKESTGGLFGNSEEAPKASTGGLFGSQKKISNNDTSTTKNLDSKASGIFGVDNSKSPNTGLISGFSGFGINNSEKKPAPIKSSADDNSDSKSAPFLESTDAVKDTDSKLTDEKHSETPKTVEDPGTVAKIEVEDNTPKPVRECEPFQNFAGIKPLPKPETNKVQNMTNEIYYKTSGILQVLENNVKILGNYLEELGDDKISLTEEDLDKPELWRVASSLNELQDITYNYDSQQDIALRAQNEIYEKLSNLTIRTEDSFIQRTKVDKLLTQLAAFKDETNVKKLKNRPLEYPSVELQTSVRQKLQRYEKLKKELLLKLMTLKTKLVPENVFIQNAENMVFKINERILDHLGEIDRLAQKFGAIEFEEEKEEQDDDVQEVNGNKILQRWQLADSLTGKPIASRSVSLN